MLSGFVAPALRRLLEERWKDEIDTLQHLQQPGEAVAYQLRVSISTLGLTASCENSPRPWTLAYPRRPVRQESYRSYSKSATRFC
jgi:hypothetical protein